MSRYPLAPTVNFQTSELPQLTVDSLLTLRSRAESLLTLRSRVDSLLTLRSRVDSLLTLRSRVESLLTLRSRVESLLTLRSRAELTISLCCASLLSGGALPESSCGLLSNAKVCCGEDCTSTVVVQQSGNTETSLFCSSAKR